MPRPRKRDILRETWEYTLLANDFSEFDDEAKNLSPPAGTMSWRGYSYPSIAYKFFPSQADDGSSGPWWLPDDSLWQQDDFTLAVLSKAVSMECVPVIKDIMLLESSNIEIVRQETVLIPKIEGTNNRHEIKLSLRQMMNSLVTCALDEKEVRFTELLNTIRSFQEQVDKLFRVKICLVKFPHRIWIEGMYHTRIHPVIVIPTNVFERYHTMEKE